jgi:hypothetical protein
MTFARACRRRAWRASASYRRLCKLTGARYRGATNSNGVLRDGQVWQPRRSGPYGTHESLVASATPLPLWPWSNQASLRVTGPETTTGEGLALGVRNRHAIEAGLPKQLGRPSDGAPNRATGPVAIPSFRGSSSTVVAEHDYCFGELR